MTSLISAVADLWNTVLAILFYAALVTGAFVLFCWSLIIAGWRFAKRADRKEAEAAALEDATIAMLDAWKDKPGIIPDALDRDIRQWLEEGERRD